MYKLLNEKLGKDKSSILKAKVYDFKKIMKKYETQIQLTSSRAFHKDDLKIKKKSEKIQINLICKTEPNKSEKMINKILEKKQEQIIEEVFISLT